MARLCAKTLKTAAQGPRLTQKKTYYLPAEKKNNRYSECRLRWGWARDESTRGEENIIRSETSLFWDLWSIIGRCLTRVIYSETHGEFLTSLTTSRDLPSRDFTIITEEEKNNFFAYLRFDWRLSPLVTCDILPKAFSRSYNPRSWFSSFTQSGFPQHRIVDQEKFSFTIFPPGKQLNFFLFIFFVFFHRKSTMRQTKTFLHLDYSFLQLFL